MSDRLKALEHNGETRTPVLAKCKVEECGFVWPIAYCPMELVKAAELMSDPRCPMCATRGAYAL